MSGEDRAAFVSELQAYDLSVTEFMDLYMSFTNLDNEIRLEMIQEYTDLITQRKKGED